jgi:hypothetical protein
VKLARPQGLLYEQEPCPWIAFGKSADQQLVTTFHWTPAFLSDRYQVRHARGRSALHHLYDTRMDPRIGG